MKASNLDFLAIRRRQESRREWDRIRQDRARKAREADQQDWRETEREYRAFNEIDALVRQSPNQRVRATLAPRQAVNAELDRKRREWKGFHGRGRKPKAQAVKNQHGQTVIVMTRADKDKMLMERLGMSNKDMD